MKLAVDTRNNEILNSTDLGMGIFEPTTLLNSWLNIEGEVEFPEWFELIDYNGSCTFNDEELIGYRNEYYYVDGVIELQRKADEYTIKQGIAKLNEKLKESDYKVIKAYEASLVGKETTYDFDAVHEERQTYRDEINRLEELLNSIYNDKK